MANVNTVNNLGGDLTLTGTQNVSVSDDGLQTITLTGPDLSPLATTAELNAVSGTLSSEIDSDIVVHASVVDAHHSRYTDAEAVTATQSARDALEAQIGAISNWEELAHVTLTSESTEIVTSTFAERDLLRLEFDLLSSGTEEPPFDEIINAEAIMEFNSDNTQNYGPDPSNPMASGVRSLMGVGYSTSQTLPVTFSSDGVLNVDNREKFKRVRVGLVTNFKEGLPNSFDEIDTVWHNDTDRVTSVKIYFSTSSSVPIPGLKELKLREGSNLRILGRNLL